MIDNIINLKNNALQFNYFSDEPENDWIPLGNISDGIFYKPTLVRYPYLAQDDKLIKLDNKEQIDINPFNFIIQENQAERSFINQKPHDFVVSENFLEFSSGTPVFEIRTKNYKGQCQPWQAILGEFNVYRTLKTIGKIYLRSPIETELERFKDLFEIRYSGTLVLSYFGSVAKFSKKSILV